MGNQTHVYLIGDQTYDYGRALRELLHSEHEAILSSFFERSYYALRAEVGKLPQSHRGQFQRFSSLADLLVLRRDCQLHPALDQALTCTCQLGTFISRSTKNSGIYPEPSGSYFVGLCTGSLSAAAISSCKTLSELLPVAVHTVVVAFRTGLCAVDIGQRVEKTSRPRPASWSIAYAGLSLEKASTALKRFCENQHLPRISSPWVTASSDQSVTISGPPSILAKLRTSPDFAHVNARDLHIYAPYHAPHLFSQSDIEEILETTSIEFWSAQTAHLPLFSSTSGQLVWAGKFRSLLESSLADILLGPLRWDRVICGVLSVARSVAGLQAVVHPICTTAEPTLRSALGHGSTGGKDSKDFNCNLEPGTPSPSVETSDQGKGQPASRSSIPDGRPEKSKIAIIGASGRFPNAEDPAAFWDLLQRGLDVHKIVPARSWNAETHVDPTMKRKNTAATPYGCWLDHPELFDSKFFNISPREAPQVDPAQRMALMTAYEAIEQAGLVPDGSPSTQKDRVGVVYGCTSQDWMETNSPQDIDAYYIPGGNRAFIPGRINYVFKFSGLSLSIDTACSSSLAAINVACLALWRGDIDTAIAGGTNVLTNPDPTAGLDRGHFLSRTGNCKTFDDGADGYCRGEGVGTVILKRLEDAIAENDPIQGVILGAYTNHSAEAESITRPHVGAQEAIFQKILNHSGVDPYDVGYVEMHGTGTQAGDASEMTSVLKTFAPQIARKRKDDQKLYVGSAKANIGHGEAASGVTSLIKVLLMLKNDSIPPHCGIKTRINHKFPIDLAERNVLIADSVTPWKRSATRPRRIFLNNFSAAGGNSALLLEDVPQQVNNDLEDPRSTHVVAVSAQAAASLKGNLESLLKFLNEISDPKLMLPRLSYTTTARRMHFPHRVLIRGSSLDEIKSNLQIAIDQKQGMTRSKSSPKIMFTFTGQGSQYPGMSRELLENFSTFRSDIDRFDRIAQSQGFPSIKPVFVATEGDIDDFSPIVVQIATTCLEIALSRLWASWGVMPQAVVGHSLGEYAALNVAGVLSESDAIYLVGRRAQLLQEQCSRATHAMLAVKSPLKTIISLLKDNEYEIACINGPEDTVVAGKSAAMQDAQKVLASNHVKAIMLKLPYAFHSIQVDPLLKDLESAARGITFREPSLPVLCPLDARVVRQGGTYTPSYISKHCRQPVNLLGAIQAAVNDKVLTPTSFVLEIGPQPVVARMVKATLGSQITIMSSLQRNKSIWPVLAESITSIYNSGAQIWWSEYHRDFRQSQRVLALPAYHWDLKVYWMQYKHDWSLRKGDPPLVATDSQPSTKPDGTEAETLKLEAATVTYSGVHKVEAPKLESTTVHKVVEESVNNKSGTVVIESDIARKDLNPFVQGHKVNGTPLCTPSVYADIALTIGQYLLDRYQPNMKERLIDVSEMTIEKALVRLPKSLQLIRASAKVDWTKKDVFCRFLSTDENGKTTAQHANCHIRFKDISTERENALKKADDKKRRIVQLYEGLSSGKTHRFSKSMAYRMVSALAEFDPDYQAVSEVVLDSKHMESSSLVDFKNVKKGGNFHTHPAYIDNLSQSGGFVMNCNDSANLHNEIFVNHGWKSFQMYESFEPDEVYRTHVQMSVMQDRLWQGDVLVFRAEKLVACFGGVLLQGVPRRLMNMILAQEMGQGKPQTKLPPAKQLPNKSAPRPVAPAAKSSEAHETEPTKKQPSSSPMNVKTQMSKPATSALSAVPDPTHRKSLEIVSEESGIALEELTDDSNFGDMGVDSLLFLINASRIKDELEIEIDSTNFSEFQTIKDLKDFLGPGEVAAEATDEAEKVQSESDEEYPATPELSTASTPSAVAADAKSSGNTGETFARVLEIISEESGVSVDDLTDDSNFADMGIDSLLSLIIGGRCREELSLEVDSNTMFVNIATVKDLRDSLTTTSGCTSDADETNEDSPGEEFSSGEGMQEFSEATSTTETPPSAQLPTSEKPRQESHRKPAPALKATVKLGDEETPIQSKEVPQKVRTASSVLLQGRPRVGGRTLFLFPDGAGSASSYAKIPKVSPDLAIVGLNCPYARVPEEMTCTLDQLIKSYINEIRRRQVVGPYHLGGWSAGGILAYRAAQELICECEEVASLVLIDSPVPKGLGKLPQRFMDHCETIGIWGLATGKDEASGAPPKTLIPHFSATMDILRNYYAEPLPQGMTPKTSIIWATESIMVGDKELPPGDDDCEDMKFLSEKRTDFSATGWADLFPGDEIVVERAEGANHFSLMQEKEHSKKLAEFIDKATRV